MSTPTAPERAARRAAVRQLADAEPQLSARQIAARLGLSKDTVRRDLDALRQTAPDAARTKAPPAPSAPDGALRLTNAMRQSLAVFAEAGQGTETAIELALATLARAYTGAWKFGLYPHGTPPRIDVVRLLPQHPEKP
ncbi:helix-turn-helix domain-containing protein [Streptomyces sp. NPDC002004]